MKNIKARIVAIAIVNTIFTSYAHSKISLSELGVNKTPKSTVTEAELNAPLLSLPGDDWSENESSGHWTVAFEGEIFESTDVIGTIPQNVRPLQLFNKVITPQDKIAMSNRSCALNSLEGFASARGGSHGTPLITSVTIFKCI